MRLWILPPRPARRGSGMKSAPQLWTATRARVFWGCMSLCLLALTEGCAGTGRSTEHATVTGQVTHNGKPLTGGSISFVATVGGWVSGGVIDESGNYSVSAPLGEVKISIDNSMLMKGGNKGAMMMKGGGGAGKPRDDAATPVAPKGTYMKISAKYHSFEASGLTYTVTKGAQTFNIELKD